MLLKMNECRKNEIRVFVKYYRAILKKFLNPVPLLDYLPCFSEEVKRNVNKAVDDQSQQVDILLTGLENSNDEGVLRTFLDATNASEENQWLYPLFDERAEQGDVEEIFEYSEKIEEISRLFELLQPQLHNIQVHHCIDVLSPWLAKHDKENLQQKHRNYGNSYTVWWLFRVLIRKQKGWIEEFKNFVQEHRFNSSTDSIPLINVILEYFDFDPVEILRGNEDEQHHHEKCLSSPSNNFSVNEFEKDTDQNCIVLNIVDSSAAETFHFAHRNDEDGACEKNRDALDLSIDVNSLSRQENIEETLHGLPYPHKDYISNACDDASFEASEVNYVFPPLRNYQKELVDLAVKGKNVIICAPPGTGKTRVAAYIIKTYLETRGNSQKYVLFFTPGSSLAQQQQQRLEEILPKEFFVELCHGHTDSSSLELHKDAEIVVLTPRILLNSLLNKTKDNPIKSIGQFGLMIFDECHHCMKGHDYNSVMREYFNFKRHLSPDQNLPQVVGLTATISVGKKSYEAQAKVLQLCSNLDVQSGIVTVRDPENQAELDKYAPQPKQETIRMPQRGNNQFYEELISTMNKIMKILQPYPAFSALDPPPKFEKIDDNVDQLVQWIQYVKRSIAKSDDEEQRDIISCMEYLELCGTAKDMFLKCRPVDALQELERFEDLKQPEKFTTLERNLFAMFQEAMTKLKKLAHNESCQNPNLSFIKRYILDKFKIEPKSTAMFMVQKQMYSKAIKAWMQEDESLKFLNAEFYTGTKGMTHEQQRTAMKAFQEGEHRMLISTPEASGEGIDVAHCNIVVEYDFLKTEVATTQIKGRVRKSDGEVLQLSSYKVAKRDESNLQKMLLMHRTIKSVQNLQEETPLIYLKQLAALQEKSRQAHQAAMLAKLAMRPKDTGKEYFLQCRKCTIEVCSSLDVRVVDGGQHTIPTIEFEGKRDLKEHPRKSPMGPNWEKLHKVLCKKCSNDWGIEAMWDKRLKLPLVKIEGFRVISIDGKKFLPKKWKNSPFVPVKSCLDDLLLQMPQDDDSDTDEDM